MELRHLRYFLAVAEELNFSRAALRLHIAQPALSQQIRQLEDELGLQLLERGTRPLRLTEAGRFFQTEALAVLAKLDLAVAGVRRIGRGEVGWIGVAYVTSAMNLLLPPILRRFHAEHPGVEVLLYEILPFEQPAALLERRVHVGFVRPGIDHAELVEESLYDEPIVVALPSDHRWAGRAQLEIADLVDEPVILFGGRMTRGVDSSFLRSLFRAAGVEPKVAFQTQYAESALGLVAAGMGVALAAAGFGHVPRAGVSFIPLAASAPSIPMKVAYRPAERSPVVQAFLKITREVAAGLPPWR
ncbi:MAG TPA: LysR substrate-binding domain-containing protein [Aliidongia sp.]|uniref:LysR substrate-binding domain-containing protein n=1 Tax=Aliidongia sp. TaxID=1914230 RepID=UPI002DDCF284|nr:LysR substrate-binding domain-containing protein [Aliidongia sp.]HEV2673691.1 LysR substrate-binding domain-containing protein [Aliidongia sp.]